MTIEEKRKQQMISAMKAALPYKSLPLQNANEILKIKSVYEELSGDPNFFEDFELTKEAYQEMYPNINKFQYATESKSS